MIDSLLDGAHEASFPVRLSQMNLMALYRASIDTERPREEFDIEPINFDQALRRAVADDPELAAR